MIKLQNTPAVALSGVVAFLVIWIFTTHPNCSVTKGVHTAFFHDYIAIYVELGANVILIDRHPKYTAGRKYRVHQFSRKALGNVISFVRPCIMCERGACNFNDTSATIDLPGLAPSKLYVNGFARCELPSFCYWFGQSFECHDLVNLVALVT